ncbi:MAG: aminopeptidase [Clostridia bacterium]|nr:aminopeptidase [Clostridia bacterium]
MTNSNIKELANQLIYYSCDLKRGEKILINVIGEAEELAGELVKTAYQAGAIPFLHIENTKIERQWLLGCTTEQLNMEASWQLARMKQMDAYIGLRARGNAYEMSDVPLDKIELYEKLLSEPVHHGVRVPHTKWVVLRYPNDTMAQEARMSTEAFAEMYYKVCNLDYRQLSAAMTPLAELMEATDKVEIFAPGTELYFSIKDIPAIKCDGRCNIPDGEVYTAPIRDSVEGRISYNIPSVHQGISFENVVLEFERGKIVKATAGSKTESINKVFDIDEGARYIGEFALGLNPFVTTAVNDILFDEKICGSFHFTPGACYDNAYNGNKSALHWDLVNVLRKEAGGGEIRFDGKTIQKDGIFILPQLAGLNPENFTEKL